MAWKTVKVVVAVPVNGRYSERDLKYDVQGLLDESFKPSAGDTEFGKTTVKGYAISQGKLKPTTKYRTLKK
jgi:hypothetical protein